MNQAVQVQEGYSQDDEMMILQVIVSGLMMQCHINNLVVDDMALFYQNYQFDIEDHINDLVENEDWDVNGIIHINAQIIRS
ncbi:hypothetical protein [Paraglaciecola sp. L1A13]|uniref:hypothetical protein n=1 Tax=Paraglaciecola sp. L1A13 TaxID=2686359 RepID=UPI00131EC611|nr:hypothetical protein [Paraglaciecola sp. L1A13]